MAEVSQGESPDRDGVDPRFDAPRNPRGVGGSFGGDNTLAEVVVPIEELRLGAQGTCELLRG